VDRDARRLRLLDDNPYPVLEVDICIPELGLVIEYDGSYWPLRQRAARFTEDRPPHRCWPTRYQGSSRFEVRVWR